MPAKTGAHHGMKYGYNTGEDGYGTELSATIQRTDNLITRAVRNRTNTPPGSPSHGHRYIVGTSPSGVWSSGGSKANQIAAYDGDASAWIYYVPEKGWDAFDETSGRTWVFNGSGWQPRAEVQAAYFATCQGAIDAAAAFGGGMVEFPARTLNASSFPAFTGMTIPDNVSIRGEGNRATIFSLSGQSTSLDAIKVEGSHVTLSNFRITGQGSSGSGRGIFVGKTATTLKNILIENFYISGTPSWAIEFGGDTGGTAITILSELRCGYIAGMIGAGGVKAGHSCTALTVHLI